MAKTVDNGTLTDYTVATNAGAVDDDVQRVTLASDDPAVVALQALDNAVSGNELQVDVVTMPTVTVTGTVTANAGTNLSTAALAVESGGNLDAIAGSAANIEGTVSSALVAQQAIQAAVEGTLAVGGTVAVSGTVAVTDNASTLSVDDGGGALTVDGTVTVQDGGGSLTVDGTVGVSGTVAVTDNAGSLTVDNAGTFAVQAAQSGTWTVQPGNTANTTAWKVDGSAVTQPVSDAGGSLTVDGTVAATQSGTWNITNVSGTVSLPTGAATAAKQPALGTAGTPSADVITVQGVTSMTALKVDGSGVTQPVSGTFWQATQPVSLASAVAVTDNSGSLTVDDGGSSLTVDGTVAISGTVAVTDNASTLSIDDGGGSITVDGSLSASLTQGRISATPTVSTTPAYTAKDAVGGKLTFANAAATSGGSITIPTVIVIDNSQQMPALELVLFDRDFTASSDNAAFDPSDADLANVVGVVPMTTWFDFNTNSVSVRTGLGLSAKLNGTSLYGQLVTRGTPTFVATSDITVIVEVIKD